MPHGRSRFVRGCLQVLFHGCGVLPGMQPHHCVPPCERRSGTTLSAPIQLFPAPPIERLNPSLPHSAIARGSACPVPPVLGQVDGLSVALVQAARQAGVQPVLCASPEQAQARAHAAGAALVVLQAAAMLDAPGVVVATLRRGGALRLVALRALRQPPLKALGSRSRPRPLPS